MRQQLQRVKDCLWKTFVFQVREGYRRILNDIMQQSGDDFIFSVHLRRKKGGMVNTARRSYRPDRDGRRKRFSMYC